MVAAEDGVLDEAAFVDERQEGFFAGEVVVFAVVLCGARGASCVYSWKEELGVSEARRGVCVGRKWAGGRRGREGRERGSWKDVRETEKPNVSGCSKKRRLRIVDLPEPEGPEMTIGRVEVIFAVVVRHRVSCGFG